MAALQWDQAEQKFYHSGVSKVILFPDWNATSKRYTGGVAWNGVTSIEESPDGGEANDIWADNIKYGSMRAVENLTGSISAYQWPDELNALDGKLVIDGIAILGQQKRTKRFGLCYRTEIGTESNPNAGYQLHFLYDVMLSPSEKSYETITDSPDATEFSWDFECLPQKQTYIKLEGYRNLFQEEPMLYEGEHGKRGYYYASSDEFDGDNVVGYVANHYSSALSKLLPYGTTAIMHYMDKTTRSDISALITVYGYKNGKLVPASDVSNMITRMRFPRVKEFYHEIMQDADAYIQYRSGNPEDWPDKISYLGLTFTSPFDPDAIEDEIEIVEPIVSTTNYAFSSVILDSRSTSAEKMEAISNMIYDGTNDMPALSDLLS